jgi:hypothetical protein
VKIVLSAAPDSKEEGGIFTGILNKLRARLPNDETCFAEVQAMGQEDGATLLNEWLARMEGGPAGGLLHHGRASLTEEQRDRLLGSFSSCPSPLFLRVAYGMARGWRSYDNEQVASLPRFASPVDGVPTLMANVFERLRTVHGTMLVDQVREPCSSPHPRHRTLATAPSSPHPRHRTLVTAPSPPHPRHRTYTLCAYTLCRH